MQFEQISTNGCQSYVIGCAGSCAAAIIDPEASQIDRYQGILAREGLRARYVIDTHTHADHFSGADELAEALDIPVVMHREASAPFATLRVDDGDTLIVGDLRLVVMHTPGHTRDSMCLQVEDKLFTGDTLLIGATGRTDLPTGNPEDLYKSLFNRVLKLDPALNVYPAHDYKNQGHSTLAKEIETNPRLQKKDRGEFVEMMNKLNLSAPTHITEALRTNMTGGTTVAQLLADAAKQVPFISMGELQARVARSDLGLVLLDVREKEAFEQAHIPGARHLPRGQLELRVNSELPDPTVRILVVCELGLISTLAASTLRKLGFTHAAALDGGMKAWREAKLPVESVAR